MPIETERLAYAFDQFGRDIRFVAMGPNYNSATGDFPCNSGGANTWQVTRLQNIAEQTNGLYFPMEEPDAEGNCALTDFTTHMTALGQWLSTD